MKKTLLASIIAGVLASCGTGNGDVYNLYAFNLIVS